MSKTEMKLWEKFEALERAVLMDTPSELSRLNKEFGDVEFTARALGLACRYRGLETVKVLVENGASFDYDKKMLIRIFRSANQTFDIFEENKNYSLALLDNIHLFHIYNIIIVGDQFPSKLLPLNERLRILDYLLNNAERVSFKPDDFLFFAFLANEQKMIAMLKNRGVKLSEDMIKLITEGKGSEEEWHAFCWDISLLKDEDLIPVISTLISEIGGEQKLHFTEWFWNVNRKRFIKPEFFEFLLANFNQKRMNKGRLMKMFIDLDNVSCLEICADNGWLKQPKKRDEMIEYATDNDKTECVAFLLDFKNRTADLAAEHERAEKKANIVLNAAPNSVIALKQIWRYKKNEDGNITITGYKGRQTAVVVPEKIGKSKVTVIGETAFSPKSGRLTEEERSFREAITEIILPNSIVKIGCSAFENCTMLKFANISENVEKISHRAFSNCIALENIFLPKGLKEIGDYAFIKCDSLKSLIIPDGVSQIGRRAIAYCSAIKTVELPKSLNEFGDDKDSENAIVLHTFLEGSSAEVILIKGSYAEDYCIRNEISYTYKEDGQK